MAALGTVEFWDTFHQRVRDVHPRVFRLGYTCFRFVKYALEQTANVLDLYVNYRIPLGF